MNYAFTASENGMQRAMQLLMGDKTLEAARMEADTAENAAKSNLFARMFFGSSGLFGEGSIFDFMGGD
jgi:hypothetical protein